MILWVMKIGHLCDTKNPLVAMGVAQVLVAAAALIGGHFTVVLTGFFVAAWLMSAWLFRKAAEDQAAARTTG